MTLLQHHLLALGLITTTTLTLGLFVLWKSPRKLTNRLFALYMLSLAWWSFWELLSQLSPNETIAITRLSTEYFGCCFIPTLFYHGVVTLVGMNTSRKPELLLSYVLSIVFAMLIAAFRNPLFLPYPISVAYLPYWAKAGPLYFLFLTFFITVLIRAHQTLWRACWREPSRIKQRQLLCLFVASLIAYLGGLPEFGLKYGIQTPLLNPYGLYLIPLHVIVIAYAILQFKLFDIHIAIRRSLVYSIVVTVLTVGYFGLVYAVERFFQLTFGYQSVGVSLAAFALMALAFQPLKVGIQRLVDRLFFHAPHEELIRRMERLEQEALQGEKLKAVATLAAGMAHEIKNPLSAIKTFAEYLPQKYDDPAFRERFSRLVAQEVGKINLLVQRLLQFAKPHPPEHQPASVSQLLDETIEFLQGALVNKRIEVVRAYAKQDEVWVDADQIRQVLLNVLLNSIEAMDRPGCITVSTVSENGHLDVVVADTGPGISRKELPRVFDPFYTTKPEGTGLGLSVVHSIVKEHGGRVIIDSDVGRGTTVRIQLPIQGGQG